MLELYRSAIALRRREPGLHSPVMTWLASEEDTLVYTRGDDFACVLNLSAAAIRLPDHQTCLLASGPIHPAAEARNDKQPSDGVLLPPDTAVWLRLRTDG
jgi:alpha-glucosidase